MSDLVELETGWRRLNRRMLLIHPVQEGIRFLPALAGVFILGRTRDEANHWWELAALVAVVGLGVMRYFTTRFRIHHGQIELRKGLVNKQVVATPADRVRTVDLTSPLFHVGGTSYSLMAISLGARLFIMRMPDPAAALAGSSMGGAIASHEFVAAHEQYGRNR